MKTKLYTLTAVFVAAFILSNDSCEKEYIGPEQEINQGWEDFADEVDLQHANTCDLTLTSVEGTWIEDAAASEIDDYIGASGPYEYLASFQAIVHVLQKDGNPFYAITVTEVESGFEREHAVLYSCNNEIVDSWTEVSSLEEYDGYELIRTIDGVSPTTYTSYPDEVEP